MGLALVPVGAGINLEMVGSSGCRAGHAGATTTRSASRVEVIIDDFHLPFGHPMRRRDGVQGQTLFIELLGGEYHLVRGHGHFSVIAFDGVIDPAEGQAQVREGVRQYRGRRRWRGRSNLGCLCVTVGAGAETGCGVSPGRAVGAISPLSDRSRPGAFRLHGGPAPLAGELFFELQEPFDEGLGTRGAAQE